MIEVSKKEKLMPLCTSDVYPLAPYLVSSHASFTPLSTWSFHLSTLVLIPIETGFLMRGKGLLALGANTILCAFHCCSLEGKDS